MLKQQHPEVMLACEIITKIGINYNGCADYIELQKVYRDYGKPRVFVIRDKVRITAYDINGKPLGHIETHWNNLYKWHPQLMSRHINNVEGEKGIPTKVFLIC